MKRPDPMSRPALMAGARMVLRGLAILMLLALAGLLLSACGGGGDEEPAKTLDPVICNATTRDNCR